MLLDDAIALGVERDSTASIGVALFAGETLSQVDVRKYADAAMYRAKGVGRNQVRFHATSE